MTDRCSERRVLASEKRCVDWLGWRRSLIRESLKTETFQPEKEFLDLRDEIIACQRFIFGQADKILNSFQTVSFLPIADSAVYLADDFIPRGIR
jgi:hypothetical protein